MTIYSSGLYGPLTRWIVVLENSYQQQYSSRLLSQTAVPNRPTDGDATQESRHGAREAHFRGSVASRAGRHLRRARDRHAASGALTCGIQMLGILFIRKISSERNGKSNSLFRWCTAGRGAGGGRRAEILALDIYLYRWFVEVCKQCGGAHTYSHAEPAVCT